MTDHIKVDESYIASLVKGAAWEAARISLTEKKWVDQALAIPTDKQPQHGDKDKPKDKSKDNDPADKDKANEEVETHVCPLCESELDEELSDEKIMEHVDSITAALNTLEEGDEPTDKELDAIEAEGDDDDDDDDMDEKKAKKESKVMAKVKELKDAAKGK